MLVLLLEEARMRVVSVAGAFQAGVLSVETDSSSLLNG